MKITALRLKNINSLKGEFKVDFDRLGQGGIFAITGPTGSGKTTILDGICIALYGMTPRLGLYDINEVMSRHTGECYTEVEFEVKQGRFLSRWSQRRARGKADGKMQQASMMLYDLDKDKVIEERKVKVVKKIEIITGLDFQRFTKSVMLAQGSFSAFLNANDSQRAELLENMTGTQIYSLISMQVYERAKSERKSLDDLIMVKDSLDFMGLQEIQDLLDKQSDLDNAIKKQADILKIVEQDIKVKTDIEELEKDITEKNEELELIEKEYKEFADDFKRLDNALKALTLKPNVQILKNIDIQTKKTLSSIDTIKLSIPDLQNKKNKIENKVSQKKQEYEIFVQQASDKEEVILKAEKKDQEILLLEQKQDEHKDILQNVNKELSDFKQTQKKFNQEIEKIADQLKAFLKYKSDHAFDQTLNQDLSLMVEYFDNFVEKQKFLQDKDKDLLKNNKDSKKVLKQEKIVTKEFDLLETDISSLKDEKKSLQTQLDVFVKDTSLEKLEDLQKEYENQKQSLIQLIEIGKKIEELLSKTKQFIQDSDDNKKALEQADKKYNDLLKIKENIENCIEQLEEKRSFELLISKYEQDRQRLQKDKPCPLCGSYEHPWKHGIEIQPDKTKSILTKQKKEFKKIGDNISDLIGQKSELASLLRHFNELIDSCDKEVKQLNKIWETHTKNLNIDIDNPLDWQKLDENYQTLQYQSKQVLDKIKKIRSFDKNISIISENILKAEEKRLNIYEKLQKVREDKQYIENEKSKIEYEIKELCDQIKKIGQTLKQKLTVYNVDFPKKGDEKVFCKIMTNRKNRYQENLNLIADHEKESARLKESISVVENNIKTYTKRFDEENNSIMLIQSQIDILRKERFELLGNNSTSIIRKELKDMQKNFLDILEKMESDFVNIKMSLKEENRALATYQSELDDLSVQKREVHEEFLNKLQKIGFENEHFFYNALLPDDELSILQNKKQDLLNKKIEVIAKLDESDKKLKVKLQKVNNKYSLETLSDKYNKEKVKFDSLNQEIGALNNILEHQKKLQLELKDKLDKIENQRQEYEKWEKLNHMIGSADGKKFQRFAQGITLDYLVSLANKHLQKLNERYLLNRSHYNDLGLEVIDTYQADITRPTNTLSGGETFLVSLALALGLAGITSGNTTVDSFFLDEGFGSLDTESLDIALSALDNLNATGKTIGIISHVETLKERVPVQLQVQKLAGGVSCLNEVYM